MASLYHAAMLKQSLLNFDTRYGTDTDGEIPVELLDHPAHVAGQAVSYEATIPGVLRVMLGHLPVRPRDYAFVDLGSGKGRVVLLAARHGFRQVVGVESSPTLHATACQNLRAWARAGHDARHITLRCEDASQAAIPETPVVVYLFNPFRERTVSRVLLNLKWSLQRCPRDLWLVYYNPQFGFMLESSPYLARVYVGRGYDQGDFAIWRSHGDFAGAHRLRTGGGASLRASSGQP